MEKKFSLGQVVVFDGHLSILRSFCEDDNVAEIEDLSGNRNEVPLKSLKWPKVFSTIDQDREQLLLRLNNGEYLFVNDKLEIECQTPVSIPESAVKEAL